MNCLFSTNAVLLNFVSTEVEIRREAFVYKGTNLLAEIGGALGLFLGVSFLSVWEILENLTGRFACSLSSSQRAKETLK